eukprot:TRINITY_DN20907_c0_g1_i1.p1 TRINITY_DN20907_c0_g1~~TRINITY_DN20907_c0_g1_i1.p1  ORF type:complete len:562 (-),score=93.39 TRINITY_DN20907_c0_g1_i1:314-1999(-)
MENRESKSRESGHGSGKSSSSLRDFRFRVPTKPSIPVQYGVVKRLCEKNLASTSEDIGDGPSDDHLTGDARINFFPEEKIPGKIDGKNQFMEMKTLCTGKKAVKMPSNEEHRFLKFCGLGLKSWQCPMEYGAMEFRSALLTIYPRLSSVIGFTFWTLTENMKILVRIPDEETSLRQLQAFQRAHCTDILIIVPAANLYLMEEKREYLSQLNSQESSQETQSNRSFCLVCGTKESPGYVSDFYRIKTDQMPQWTKKQTIEEKLEEILGMNFERQTILSDRMCQKCFKYISWIDKMEGQLKRSRGLLSNAFHATNSKLNRLHVSNKRERATASAISEDINLGDVLDFSQGRSVSPDIEIPFPSSSQTKPQYTCDRVSSSSSPILLPTLANMSTFASFSSAANYTSGYESSSSQQDIETTSPMPSDLSISAPVDRQTDSCFESDSSIHQHESPILRRRPELSHIHNFGGRDHPKYTANTPTKGIKRNKSPNYCWELLNSDEDPPIPKISFPLKKRPFSHEQPSDPPDSPNPDSPEPLNLINTSKSPSPPKPKKEFHVITETLFK